MVAGVTLGIGFGEVLNLDFFRKQQFLSVILPDPSTLIWYWRFGRAAMTFPVVFHWWFSGLCMATVSPVCNGGEVVGVSILPFYYFAVSVVKEFIAALSSCYPFGV